MEMQISKLDLSVDVPALGERLAGLWVKQFPNQPNEINSFTPEQIKASYRQVFEEQREASLIFCTCRSCMNDLMWKKYADKYRGICLGFYMPTFYEPYSMFTTHVEYSDTLQPLPILGNDEIERFIAITQWANTKGEKWMDEQEVRCFIPNADKQISHTAPLIRDIFFDTKQLMEIYFGPYLSLSQIRNLENIIARKTYEFKTRGRVIRNQSNGNLTLE